jgi:hypothetical protein
MKISELFESEKMTLSMIYDGDLPDRDEIIWDYIGNNEFDIPLMVEVMPKHKLMITLLSQYRAEHIDEIYDLLEPDQEEIVDHYKSDPNLSNSIIIVADGKIIDGNHRALAAALTNRSIKYVDLNTDTDQ